MMLAMFLNRIAISDIISLSSLNYTVQWLQASLERRLLIPDFAIS